MKDRGRAAFSPKPHERYGGKKRMRAEGQAHHDLGRVLGRKLKLLRNRLRTIEGGAEEKERKIVPLGPCLAAAAAAALLFGEVEQNRHLAADIGHPRACSLSELKAWGAPSNFCVRKRSC